MQHLILFYDALIAFLNQSTIPGVIQNISIVLLTIFIAVAIFLVDKDTTNFELDRKVILNKVIQAKSFISYLILLFLPLLFWEISPTWLRWSYIGVFFISIVKILESLYRTYKWMDVFEPKGKYLRSNYRMNLRLNYLEGIKDLEERAYEWNYIWDTSKDISVTENKQYFEKFQVNIEQLLEERNYNHISQYLTNFTNSVNNLPLYDWPLYEMILKTVLDWNKISYDLNKDAKKHEIHFEISTANLLKELVSSIGRHKTDYIFFRFLEEHVNTTVRQEDYVKNLLGIIANPLFELKDGDLLSIFDDNFPTQWKITKSNLESNVVSRMWLYGNYLPWVRRKIWDNRESPNFDKNLDAVSYELVPDADPPTWSTWLTFLLQPWVGDRKVDALLNSHKCFGVGSRPLVTSGSDSSEQLGDLLSTDIHQKTFSTYELLFHIFPKWLSIQKLGEYKAEAEALEYEKHTTALLKQKQFVRQINEMIRLKEKA